MIVRGSLKDSAFKRGLTQLVTRDEIQLRSIQSLVRKYQFRDIGAPFALFASGKLALALEKLDLERSSALGSDSDALYFLDCLLRLAPHSNSFGNILLADLESRADRVSFLSALDFALQLHPNVELAKAVVSMEVDVNCESGSNLGTFYRIGNHGNSRLADYLLDGPENMREFTLDQFDHLHKMKVQTYDSAYPAIQIAVARSSSEETRHRLRRLQHYIEKSNPRAIVPAIALDTIRVGRDQGAITKQFSKLVRKRKLSKENACLAALLVADRLSNEGDSENSAAMFGQAAALSRGKPELMAWIGLRLEDAHHASQALIDYAKKLSTLPAPTLFADIEIYHSIEAACRLLFQKHPQSLYDQVRLTLAWFHKHPLKKVPGLPAWPISNRLKEWGSYGKGFPQYLHERAESMRGSTGDKDHRAVQRRSADSHFLLGVDNAFESHLAKGRRLFEESSIGNDAPWIQGNRFLLMGLDTSLRAFKTKIGSHKSLGLAKEAQQYFKHSSIKLESDEPLALSLSFRGLLASCKSVTGEAIHDLSLAISLLRPRTPEIAELRNRIADARWNLMEIQESPSLPWKEALRLWMSIARVGPLIYDVIVEDSRIERGTSPTGRIWMPEPINFDLTEILSVGSAQQRGLALENLMSDLVRTSPGLRLVDVRHSNNFEEIDLIIEVTHASPLVSYWGPIIIMECKNWKEKANPDVIRSFYGKMSTKKDAIRLGIFVSPSGYTSGVSDQIRQLPKSLVLTLDGEDLKTMLSGRTNLRALVERKIPFALFA